MAHPTDLSIQALKRVGRYLEGAKRLVYKYPWQSASMVDIYSDTDWAGCGRTRKSTSGGCLVLGRHLLKSWSSTQAAVALSSGEAEFYGVIKAAGIGMGYRSLLSDLGVQLPLRVWTDSTATIGICGRRGLGKLRHIGTHHLWIQGRVRDGTFELRKVLGTQNPADLMTKHLTGSEKVPHLLRLFGCELREGRAASAPHLRRGPGQRAEENLLLTEAQNEVGYDGLQYPGVLFEGEMLPEARSYSQERLPHLHEELHTLFPRAMAMNEEEESEEEADMLEIRGLREGGGERALSDKEHRLLTLLRADRRYAWRRVPCGDRARHDI